MKKSSQMKLSIQQIKKLFGIKPLIVQLLPQDGEGSKDWYRYWTSYPDFVEKEIEKCLPNNGHDICMKKVNGSQKWKWKKVKIILQKKL